MVLRLRKWRYMVVISACLLALISAGCSSSSSDESDQVGNGDTANQSDTNSVADGVSDGQQQSDAAEDTQLQPDTSIVDSVEDTTVPDQALAKILEKEISFVTGDGKTIHGTLYRAETTQPKAPGILLVHQFSQERSQWAQFVPDLAHAGYIVLAIDLRGHGKSDPQTGQLPDILNDPNQAPLDVQSALGYLIGDGAADPLRLAIIGTSIGANLACVANGLLYGVKLAVAVSARSQPVGNLANAPADQLNFSGLFIIASKNDGGGDQAATTNQFFDQTSPPRQKLVIDGSEHGKDILANHPEVWQQILGFLSSNL